MALNYRYSSVSKILIGIEHQGRVYDYSYFCASVQVYITWRRALFITISAKKTGKAKIPSKKPVALARTTHATLAHRQRRTSCDTHLPSPKDIGTMWRAHLPRMQVPGSARECR